MTSELVLLGRHRVERWTVSPSSLSLVGCEALPPDPAEGLAALPTVLQALFRVSPPGKVVFLLETVWLPAMLIELGPTIWKRTQVEILLRHRLGVLHAGSQSFGSGSAWDQRLDYWPGDGYALGYGMSTTVKDAVLQAAGTLGLRLSVLLPAFAWGLSRFRPSRLLPAHAGWWVWPEQDRLLVARLSSNKVVALNAGTTFTTDGTEILRLVRIECARCGIAEPEHTIAAAWGKVPAGESAQAGLNWLAVSAEADAEGMTPRQTKPLAATTS